MGFIVIYRPLFTHKQQAIKPLTAVMSAIEQQFNIKFSYAVEEVVYLNIEKPATDLTLQETIAPQLKSTFEL
jgi:hypothetical protein